MTPGTKGNHSYRCRVRYLSAFMRQVWNNAASEVNSGDAFASFLVGAASGGSAD